MKDEQKTSEVVDYGAQMETRRRNFVSRAVGAAVGGVAGVAVGMKQLKNSLRQYLNDRLHTRDWINGHARYEESAAEGGAQSHPITTRLREVLDNIRDGKANTSSGAPTTEENLKAWAQDYLSGKTDALPGTSVGDRRANAAYRDLITHNSALVDKCIDDFGKRATELKAVHDTKMASLEKSFFKASPSACWDEVAKIEKDFARRGNVKEREAAIDDLAKKNNDSGLFKGSVHKFFEEFDKTRENLNHYTNEAKKELVDKPIFDEMMKHGTQPGRMGLGFRHAHNKGEIFAFAAGATVAGVVVAHAATKKFLARNDRKHQKIDSYQENVMQQREAQASQSVSHA